MGWQEFEAILNETPSAAIATPSYIPPEQQSTKYTPAGNPENWPLAYRPLGLPADPMSKLPPPGFETTVGADSAGTSLFNFSGLFDDIKQNAYGAFSTFENSIHNAYGGVKDITKTVYGDLKNAAGSVYDDVATPVKSALTSTYWYMLLGVGVVGVIIYFAGKSGALRVSR